MPAVWWNDALTLLALKIDVDTWRGTREGVPRLLDTLARYGADATFLFSLGPDHTGRALRRVFRRGFLGKVSRTSVLAHYGWRTLLYGVLLPGPDISRRGMDILRRVQAAGFEVGVHAWDHVRWQDQVSQCDAVWTDAQIRRACDRFTEIFGVAPRVHGAAGWQMNLAAFRLERELGITHASDTRGVHPFIPQLDDGSEGCVQLPTTLPTLDELIGTHGIGPGNVHTYLLDLTRVLPAAGHVYTLHAELEGQRLQPVFERLLAGWQAQGYRLVSLATLYAALDEPRLPRCRVLQGEVPGRSGQLMTQGRLV